MEAKIRVICELDELDAMREDWNRLYHADSEATTHRSWPWFRAWAATTDLEWRVLCAIDPSSRECFGVFAIALLHKVGGLTTVFPGGHPLAAHTGFLCQPNRTSEALHAWCNYLENKVQWDQFQLKDFMDSRLNQFVELFGSFKYSVQRTKPTTCPSVALPATWDEYFHGCVGKETRKTYKKRFSRLEREADITVALATTETLDESLDALLSLWQARWGQKSEHFVVAVKTILSTCFKSGSLYLRLMRANGVPIAVVAVYTDVQHNTAQCYMSGYDDRYSRFSPGNVLIFDSINAAIDSGITEYDFGRGAQDYKYSVFGARDRYNSNVTISRCDFRSALRSIVRKSLRKICRK